MSSAEPRLTAIVLTYGESGVHRELMDSLEAEGLSPERILVVHNPARDGEPDPAIPAGARLIRSERNLGYAGGMNRGLAALGADTELALLLTHDARLAPGALARLVAAAAVWPGYGVLGPALVMAGTDEPFSFGGTTNRWGATDHRKLRPTEEVAECDWVDGGTMLVRTAVLERAGGFDERFWGYCEESDLCLRVRRGGFRVGVVVGAVAEQDPGGPKRPGAWAYLLTRNGAELARRAVGRRGAVAAIGRAVREVLVLCARMLARTVRPQRGGRRQLWLQAIGVTRGALDFLRGRWGPPPADLPGSGDLHNA